MTYFVLGCAVLSIGGFLYCKYSSSDMMNIVSKTIGYANIYFNKFYKRYCQNKNVSIYSIKIDSCEKKLPSTLSLNEIENFEELEIEYLQNGRIFSIVYFNEDNDDFKKMPIYENCELENRDKFALTDNSIILLEVLDNEGNTIEQTDNELIDYVKKLSGPKGNFYKDIRDVNGDELYKNRLKQYILKNLRTGNYPLDSNLEIMYSNGDILKL